MAERPTADDMPGFLGLQTDPSDRAMALYDEAMAAAIDELESRISADFVEADGFSLDEGTTDYPPSLRFAVMMEASRFRKRSSSPEGVAGMSELGILVRIMGTDYDIERCIRRWLKMGGFS